MGRVTLWHGTSLDRAQRIRAEGFRPVDALSELVRVAERYDVTLDALREALADKGRFAVIQEVRSDLTWFATGRDEAERWAARAPELRWEALWAVWWVSRDADDPTPWRTPKAAGWHAQQFFGSKPGIIEMEVPVRRVLGSEGEALSPGDVRERIRSRVTEMSIRPPGEAGWIKSIWPTRRPVEFTAVAGLLRMSTDELTDAVNEGRVSEPRPGLPEDDWTWFEDELPAFAPRELLERPI